MSAHALHEHDANQGAQSSGEFLGMTGNSGWYLLGAGGATILMVIFLWGVLGVSLLLCLMVGVILCVGAVVYVFTLKNNRPAHYDTDFFEAALIEAGVLAMRFGPRAQSPANPFLGLALTASRGNAPRAARAERQRSVGVGAVSSVGVGFSESAPDASPAASERPNPKSTPPAPVVARADYEALHAELTETEAALEDALAVAGED
jgi:hypothetical protein